MRLILTDVDDVLLAYTSNTDVWVINTPEEHDVLIENLGPYKRATHAVRYLHTILGYHFHAITAVGRHNHLKRKQNLYKHFGAAPFVKLTCVDMLESKREALSVYKDSGLFWLEDSVSNAKLGQELGLRSVLFNRPWNLDKEFTGERVNDWDEFCKLVEG